MGSLSEPWKPIESGSPIDLRRNDRVVATFHLFNQTSLCFIMMTSLVASCEICFNWFCLFLFWTVFSHHINFSSSALLRTERAEAMPDQSQNQEDKDRLPRSELNSVPACVSCLHLVNLLRIVYRSTDSGWVLIDSDPLKRPSWGDFCAGEPEDCGTAWCALTALGAGWVPLCLRRCCCV